MKLAEQGAAEWLFDYTVSTAKFKCPAGRIARDVALYPQGRKRYGEVWTAILRVGPAILQDEAAILQVEVAILQVQVAILQVEAAILQDETAILQDEAAILQDETAILQDEATILQDEATILQVEATILQVEATILQVETAILQDETAILQVGMRFPPVEMTILSLWMANGEVATAFLTALPVSGEARKPCKGERKFVRVTPSTPILLRQAALDTEKAHGYTANH
jgi:hypothetical protein